MATRRLAEPEELQRKVGSGRSDLDLGSSNLVDTLVDTVMCVIAVGFVLGLCHVLNMGIEQTVSYYSQVIGR